MAVNSSKKRMLLITVLCFFYYLALMLGRHGLSAAMPGIVASGAFTKAQLGRVASGYFLAYALMQLPCGLIGDRVSAPLMMTLGALGAGLMNLLFPAAKSLAAMTLFWSANGFFQAFVWSSLMRIIALCVDDSLRTTAVLAVSASGPVGVLTTYALSALLSGRGWQAFFRVSGAFMLVMVVLWLLFRRSLTGDAPVGARSDGRLSLPLARMKAEYVLCGLPLLALVSFLHGMMKDGLSTWVPTYLSEVFSMSDRSALTLSMVLPVVNLCGLFLVRLYTRRSKGNELSGTALTFGFASAATAVMAFALTGSLPGTVVCFALLTSSMQIINAFIISLVPMRFRLSGLVASTTGILDAFIYLGSSCSGVLFGSVAEKSGWGGTRALWFAIAVAGTLAALAAIRKWAAYKKAADRAGN